MERDNNVSLPSSHPVYLEINNLYGTNMSKYLPEGGFY